VRTDFVAFAPPRPPEGAAEEEEEEEEEVDKGAMATT